MAEPFSHPFSKPVILYVGALEPQDAALLLKRPLLVLLLQLLRRLAAMAVALPVGTGGGGGRRESTAGPAPGVAVVPLVTGAVETRAGEDDAMG